MPLYLNSVSIGGYLVKSPKIDATKEGLPRTKFLVAVNNPAKEKPDYIKCVAWGERAEKVARFSEKGQAIIVVGEITTSTWQDRNGMNHTTTEIVVEKFNLGEKPRFRANEASVKRPSPPILSE